MLGVDVFARAADIATALGRPSSEVAVQRQRQASLTSAINARLRRPDGIYIDGLEPNGAKSTHASQHANAYGIAYGIVPPADETAVASYAASLGMAMGPQTAQELLEALRLAGRPDDLVTRVTDPTTDGWAKILAEGGTFTWEDWNPSDAEGDSMSHGWGSTVLVEIQQGLLGVTPTGPAFATFDVSPPVSGLASASGTVPTPRGPVAVSWSWSRAGGTFSLDLTVPANSVATVRLPAAAGRDITEGGHSLSGDPGVRAVHMDGGVAVLGLGSGTYRFRSTGIPAVAIPAATAPGAATKAGAGDRSGGGDRPPSPTPAATPGGVASPPTTASAGSALTAHHAARAVWPIVALVAVLLLAAAAGVVGVTRRRL
jgi:alpha-L-rhamnosidase